MLLYIFTSQDDKLVLRVTIFNDLATLGLEVIIVLIYLIFQILGDLL